MPRLSVAAELESAAGRIADVSRADLQIMLRRAALVLRNVIGVTLDPATDDSINGIAAENEYVEARADQDHPWRLVDRQRLSAGALCPRRGECRGR